MPKKHGCFTNAPAVNINPRITMNICYFNADFYGDLTSYPDRNVIFY